MSSIYSYIYDFLSVVFEDKDLKAKIKSIILFGSVSRDKFDKNSDIDLFFDVKYDESLIENDLRKALKSFEVKANRIWKIKGVNYPIKPIVGDLNSEKWKSLREDIISNGITLFGKFEALPEKMMHYALFYFSLEKLKRKDKMRFLRKMFGYKNIKSGKVYEHQGLLNEISGIKIGPNNMLIPLVEVKRVKDIFDEFKITPKIREIWIRE